MNFIEYLTEDPQSISNIDDDHILNNTAKNIQYARELLSHKRLQLLEELSPGVNLYELPERYIVADVTNPTVPKLIYFVQYTIKNLGFIGKRSICQILVWKDQAGYDELTGLPKRIFFDYLLPKADCIVTDYQQTSYGRTFWSNRIGNALKSGKYVYYVNFQPDRVIQQIHSIEELRKLTPTIYGNHQKYKQRRIVVTNSSIDTLK